jgi:thioredoxin reductase (NADPH)
MYDVIIIGAGPAGLSAAIYSARHGLKTLVLESVDPVSQLSTTPVIENYPGYMGGGMDLLDKFKEHALKFGVEIKLEKVIKVKNINEVFEIIGEENTYTTKAVIVASGASHKKAGVPGENEFTGRGVSYCATCDAAFYRGKKVLVIGGGNTALTEAIYLKNQGVYPTIVHRRDEFRAEKILQEEIQKHNIPVIWNTVIKEIKGNMKVNKVILHNRVTGEDTEVEVDGIFVAIGNTPITDFLAELEIEFDSQGYIIVDKEQRTNVPGLFAAGDVCNNPLKQVVTAAGDGARAAVSAFNYIKENF